jgi:TetR/AcrR family transcriptional regulator, fatty acid biosynthesis regulator
VVTRAEQKALTRDALIDSALRIIGGGANFASISLREVTKAAGLVPTSFYRHFDDMDQLGLAVVDELGLDLRRLMRGTLDHDLPLDDMVRSLAYSYEAYVHGAAELVEFVNQARTGGSPRVRAAIAHELDFFVTRVAGSLPDLVPGLRPADRETVAQLLLAVLLESTTELLATSEDDEARLEELRDGLAARLHIVMLGAAELAGPVPTRRRTSGTAARARSASLTPVVEAVPPRATKPAAASNAPVARPTTKPAKGER